MTLIFGADIIPQPRKQAFDDKASAAIYDEEAKMAIDMLFEVPINGRRQAILCRRSRGVAGTTPARVEREPMKAALMRLRRYFRKRSGGFCLEASHSMPYITAPTCRRRSDVSREASAGRRLWRSRLELAGERRVGTPPLGMMLRSESPLMMTPA